MRHVNILGKHEYAQSGLAEACLLAHYRAMNIRTIRRARGLTQVDLAEMTNIAQATISRAEKGEDGVTLGNFKSIAAAGGRIMRLTHIHT